MENPKNKIISFRINENHKERLKEEASRQGLTLSNYVENRLNNN